MNITRFLLIGAAFAAVLFGTMNNASARRLSQTAPPPPPPPSTDPVVSPL